MQSKMESSIVQNSIVEPKYIPIYRTPNKKSQYFKCYSCDVSAWRNICSNIVEKV